MEKLAENHLSRKGAKQILRFSYTRPRAACAMITILYHPPHIFFYIHARDRGGPGTTTTPPRGDDTRHPTTTTPPRRRRARLENKYLDIEFQSATKGMSPPRGVGHDERDAGTTRRRRRHHDDDDDTDTDGSTRRVDGPTTSSQHNESTDEKLRDTRQRGVYRIIPFGSKTRRRIS